MRGASLGRSLEDARVLQGKTESPLGFPENDGGGTVGGGDKMRDDLHGN